MADTAPLRRKKVHGDGERIYVGWPAETIDAFEAGIEARVAPAASPVKAFQDVVAKPLVRIALGKFEGGFYRNTTFLPDFRLERGDNSIHIMPETAPDPREPVIEDRPSWFGGPFFDHYGHFVLEGIARLTRPEIVKSDHPVYVYDPMKIGRLRGYMVSVLEALKIAPERINFIQAPIRFRVIRVAEPNVVARRSINMGARLVLQAGRAGGDKSGLLYLSRTRLKRRRQVIDEELLEALTERHGGEVYYPETHGFADQLARIGRAEIVMGVEGSAFHTLMFIARVPHRVIISPGRPSLAYLLQDELIDGSTTYVNASAGVALDEVNRGLLTVTPELTEQVGEIVAALQRQPALTG